MNTGSDPSTCWNSLSCTADFQYSKNKCSTLRIVKDRLSSLNYNHIGGGSIDLWFPYLYPPLENLVCIKFTRSNEQDHGYGSSAAVIYDLICKEYTKH